MAKRDRLLGALSGPIGGNPSVYFSKTGAWIFMKTLIKGINGSKPNENEMKIRNKRFEGKGHEYLEGTAQNNCSAAVSRRVPDWVDYGFCGPAVVSIKLATKDEPGVKIRASTRR
jgi:hypothetical protein